MATIDKATPRGAGKWKSRFGIGRRNSKKGNSADPVVGPEESDNGEARSLSAKRNQRLANKTDKKKGLNVTRKLNIRTSFRKDRESRDASETSNPQSPFSNDSFVTVESDLEEKKQDYADTARTPASAKAPQNSSSLKAREQERKNNEIIYEKQQLKERDGFCRRVDTYDGNVIVVDQKPTYEIGNYLGGGVAGVVYQGHRLRPLKEYPIRLGINDLEGEGEEFEIEHIVADSAAASPDVDGTGFFCAATPDFAQNGGEVGYCGEIGDVTPTEDDTVMSTAVASSPTPAATKKKNALIEEDADLAIEATMNQNQQAVMLDAQDAPSRSQHFTRAASVKLNTRRGRSLNHGLTDEAVAIKILNPVGFRILQSEGLKGSVVVKKGEAMGAEIKKGIKPMQEKNVWWMVNPNSRNLRTLQRYNGKDKTPGSKTVHVDRGSKNKGLRLSLIAAYIDPRTNKLRELTLTRCIEIWGHVPFDATDIEFEDMLNAIERVNAGQPPPPVNAFARNQGSAPGRVGTDVTAETIGSDDPLSPVALKTARTGLLRAALTERATVFCEELNAYIAIPAVPSKYLRWLRQRRAATKEIRNMMSIGKHKNVLHLYEVLEFIQDSKSTMFLILELVKGGELFDLISSSAGKNRKSSDDTEQAEKMMRRFFYELSSGIHYCHMNGIAHRDLKPENLLVHNGIDGQSTLKIADFGLSAAFGPNSKAPFADSDTLAESLGSPLSMLSTDGESTFSPNGDGGLSPSSQMSTSSVKDSMDKLIASGASALSFLTCGAMETVLCMPNGAVGDNGPSPLRRMTSVVGSPHYVAPEIISQPDDKSGKRGGRYGKGYDGAKADVWSAGVILYAMLFRSLPFGEDLLRCPRFQSYRKWYDEVREMGGRRTTSSAALNPIITNSDERDLLGPHWFFPAETSRESRDLIVAMLNPKPEDRLSVAQILEHPWVLAAAREV